MSALSYMTNGLGSPTNGSTLLTGGYSTTVPGTPLYRVANTQPVVIHNRSWHERPPVLDTFVSLPSGNPPSFRSLQSYPRRSMGVEEAVVEFPIVLTLLAGGRASIKPVATGILVSVTDSNQYSEGLRKASSTRRQWSRTLTHADWDRIQRLANTPVVIEMLDTLPATLSPLSPEWQEYGATLETEIRSMYEPS